MTCAYYTDTEPNHTRPCGVTRFHDNNDYHYRSASKRTRLKSVEYYYYTRRNDFPDRIRNPSDDRRPVQFFFFFFWKTRERHVIITLHVRWVRTARSEIHVTRYLYASGRLRAMTFSLTKSFRLN